MLVWGGGAGSPYTRLAAVHESGCGTQQARANAMDCPELAKADVQVECALGAGQVEASELTVGAGLSKDESHGPTTFPQHRV